MSTSNIIQSTLTGATKGFGFGAMTGMPHAAGIGAAGGAIAGFFTSMFGGGGGGGGEGSKKKQKYKDYIRETNEEKLRALYRQFAYAKDAEDAAIKLYNDEVKRTNRAAREDYEILIDNRQKVFNALQSAYKRSVKDFDEQIKLNGIQHKMSINDITRVRNERITELSFKSQNLIEAFDQARLGFKSTVNQLNRDKKILKQSFKIKRNDISQGLKDTVREAELQAKDVDNIFRDATQQADIQSRDIRRQVRHATRLSNIAKEELALARDSKRAEAAFSTQKARMEGLVNEGQQLATGQAGRSAAKSIQAYAFSSAAAQNMIADALTRSEAKYEVDIATIANDLRNSRKQGRLQLATIDQQLKSTRAKGLNSRAKIVAGLNAQRGIASRRLKELSVQLLDSQNKISDQKYASKLDQFGRERQLKLNLRGINKSLGSVESQMQADMDKLNFDLMMANKSASKIIRPRPRVPDLIPPPTRIPRYSGIRMQRPEFDRIRDLFKKADRAAAGLDLSPFADYLGAANGIANSIVDTAKTLNSLRPPANQLSAGGNDLQDFFSTDQLVDFSTSGQNPLASLGSFSDTSGIGDFSNLFGNMGGGDFTTGLDLDLGSKNYM